LHWRHGFNFIAVAHNRTALRTLRLAWRAKAAANKTQAPAKQGFRLKNSLASALLKGTAMKTSQAASCGKHQSHLKPEWVRVPDAVHLSGLSRSAIYELIAAGAIKSFSNRQRGAQRGIRLISYDSLVGYLDEQFVAAARAGAASVGQSSTKEDCTNE
jgi:hypothetical protein